jgi:copper chaperone CopZ
MKSLLYVLALILSTTTLNAQIKNKKTVTVSINGNCGMCKSTIQKAGTLKNKFTTVWNMETKMATITFDGKAIALDSIMQKIAAVGYDNEKFIAPDVVYNKLHGCCKYDRTATNNANTPAPVASTNKKVAASKD